MKYNIDNKAGSDCRVSEGMDWWEPGTPNFTTFVSLTNFYEGPIKGGVPSLP